MHNYSRHASVTTMLQHLYLPTLQQRRQHSKIIMLYRIAHKLASIPTATYIAPCIRITQHFILTYARTHVFKTPFFPSSFKYRGSVLWNDLPKCMQSTENYTMFKKLVSSWNGKRCRCAMCRCAEAGLHRPHLHFFTSHILCVHNTFSF